jgi:pimeloyl-ACP methyl ester carboxylesterase
MNPVRWGIRFALALFVAALATAPPAGARSLVPTLTWTKCGKHLQCATAKVPRDYAKPRGKRVEIALIRMPATKKKQRIGSLFVNFGGPGASAVDVIRDFGKDLYGTLNDRFDIVGFDPRGTGESKPGIDCRVDQETEGVFARPYTTPANLDVDALVARDELYIKHCRRRNKGILPYVSTFNVAHDLDLLRQAVGDDGLNYIGYSYGTFLGATYASLYPDHTRALVLDGPLDADEYINRPLTAERAQTEGFEVALNRFLDACAAAQADCPFGHGDPHAAFEALLARLDAEPIPAGGDDPRPIDGDAVREVAFSELYAKQFWFEYAVALTLADAGDGTMMRDLLDYDEGRNLDGTYDPETDRFFAISALEQQYPSDVQTYLDAGAEAFATFPHFWSNSGYSELVWGLYPVEPRGLYLGPFSNSPTAPTALVVATTYDPATPYSGALRLVEELGNARLITMDGDGHTAYPQNSPCIDTAVEAYLKDGVLPADGTVCQQDVPFVPPADRSLATRRPVTVAMATRGPRR